MADRTDIEAHEATYHGVMALLKWGTVVCLAITAFVIFLIAG